MITTNQITISLLYELRPNGNVPVFCVPTFHCGTRFYVVYRFLKSIATEGFLGVFLSNRGFSLATEGFS